MPFKVTDKVWLKVEADRVEGIILMPKYWHRAWTPQSLKEELANLGLNYSMPQMQLINDELHVRKVVVDIGQ